MNRLTKLLAQAACALATSVLVAACGGGDAEPPPKASSSNPPTTAPAPDTKAPTVSIFDDNPATSATGPVTFSFVFSEDVGASFTASDVVVTGGTAGVFTKVSGTQATLVVTPTANSAGTINVSVAAGSFSDIAGNVSTTGATAQQAYDSVAKTQMSLPVSFDSASVTYGLVGFGGAEDSTVAVDPTNAANMVAKVVRAAGAETYAGTTITATTAAGVQTGFSPKIPFNVTDTRMSVRVWSPDAGIPVRLKVEDSTDPNKSVETEATITTAAGWQTLTFNFATQATGTAPLNLAYNYNKATIFFDFGRAKASAVLKTYYFDDVAFVPGGGGGGGGATAPTNAPTTVIPSGSITIYSDASSVAGLNMAPDWGQTNITRSEVTIAGNKSEKYVFGGAPFLYQGIDWTGAAGTATIDVSAKSNLHLDLWSADIASIKISLIGSGETAVTKTLTAGSWNGIDIDLALFTGVDKTKTIQLKLEPISAGTLYVDNVYFSGGGAVSCGTTAPTCAPTTSIPSGSITIYSDASSVAGLNMAPDWGQTNITRSEVTIAGNKSEKYVFGGAPFLYQGIDWTGAAGTATIDVSTKGSLHLDLWSADIASIKISLIGGGGENAITKTLTAGSWNSIDIDLALYTGADKTKAIQLKLEPITAGTLYVDNVYFWGTAATGGGGGGTFAGGIFASDYSGNLGANTAKSDKNGTVGFFVDPRLFAVKIFEDGSVCGSACNPGGVYNFYYGIGKPASPTYADAYFGGYVNAPGNTTADASAFAKIELKFWGDAESWEKPNFTAQANVVVQGPTNAACTNPSGRPELTKAVTAQKIGAGSLYTIPKTDFVLTASCGGAYTVNSVWSAIGSVVVLLSGSSNLNYVNLTPSTPPSYPTFINIGPIKFIN